MAKKNVARAKKLIDFVISSLSKELRIDAVIWDTHDSRHDVPNRDDLENYARLFFHLLRNLIGRREEGSHWHLRPDIQGSIDWDTIHDCLGSNGTWNRNSLQILLGNDFDCIPPEIMSLCQVDSTEAPFVQLADVFAGMAAYTRKNPEIVWSLLAKPEGQYELGFTRTDIPVGVEPTDKDRGRFSVISYLYQRCKRERLGVSLRTKGYLWTYRPENPINFWHYEPQHLWDKAPSRNTAGFSSL